MAWVEINNFSYTYPGEQNPTLIDVNLCIEKGDFILVAGSSGSGKSTLGKALAGFLFQDEHPDFSGKIIVNQTDMTLVPLYQTSQRVAYVQQNPEDQFCTLTVLDEIAFALENTCLSPDEIDRRIEKALATVKGLNLRDRQLATLSGGEKQKIAIASMLAISPDVLILDEPTSNLDPDATQQIFETLQFLRAQVGLTVIIIEHKINQLRAFNPKLFVLENGGVVLRNDLASFSPERLDETFDVPSPGDQKIQSVQPLLEISHLHVGIGGKKILNDISLKIYPGEFIALMGPNGSGKSTLLNTMIGFHKPERGTLIGFGRDLTQAKTSTLVKDIGYIFQNPDHQLFTPSVWEEATLTLKNLNLLTDDRVEQAQELLAEIGLNDRLNDHPQRLSYGEKRRLNLLAAILHHPKLLLIDEFLIGQDMPTAFKWMKILRKHASEGQTILLITHHAELTQEYCDRVIFMDAGNLVIDEPVTSAFTKLALKGYHAFLPQRQEHLAYA